MAVRIRMKKMGRTHRPFYRICAFDHHTPRDGRAIEELGTYDTSVADTDARAILKADRIDYWLSVGAQPSEKVAVLIKKYGTGGTHTEQQKVALEKLAGPKTLPDLGAPAPPKQPEESPAEETTAAPAEEAAAAEETAEAPTEETPTETPTEQPDDTESTNSEEKETPPAAE
ncbi:MAG: 30S ribosomal protein S16 [Pirellulales bacterium]|nr:30S ribosomal protein S16 [Pirellulales bacterium]